MAAVRRSDTGPEIQLRRALFACGLRFRVGRKGWLPGSPDIVFTKAKVVVFVDGCFWHGCPIHGSTPRTNVDFWAAKITRNRARDVSVDDALRESGWMPVRVWEHEVRRDAEGAAIRIWALVRERESV